MFPLHDTIRRRCCLGGFFLLCIVPTAVVVGWCIQQNLPGKTQREAARLRHGLGLDVSLGGFKHLRPGATLYENLQLSDPETGRPVFRCRLLETATRQIADEENALRPALVLVASQPEFEAGAFGHLQALLIRLLQGQVGMRGIALRLHAGEMTLRSEADAQTLVDVQGGLDESATGAQVEVSFRLAGVETGEPIRVSITRNRQTLPPSLALELDTGNGSIPCSLLTPIVPSLAELGSRAFFRGRVWASRIGEGQAPDDWEAEVTGQLADIDLDHLVTARFPHKLSGMGQLTVQLARFHRGRLEEGAGTLAAGPGVMSRSLLEAAVRQLRMVPCIDLTTLRELVSYEQLAMVFVVDTRGVKMQGRCAATGGSVILTDQQGPLLKEPLSQPQPIVSLLQTLVPLSEVQVPATRQTDWLIRHLPVPEIVAAEEARQLTPRAVLRLGQPR